MAWKYALVNYPSSHDLQCLTLCVVPDMKSCCGLVRVRLGLWKLQVTWSDLALMTILYILIRDYLQIIILRPYSTQLTKVVLEYFHESLPMSYTVVPPLPYVAL